MLGIRDHPDAPCGSLLRSVCSSTARSSSKRYSAQRNRLVLRVPQRNNSSGSQPERARPWTRRSRHVASAHRPSCHILLRPCLEPSNTNRQGCSARRLRKGAFGVSEDL